MESVVLLEETGKKSIKLRAELRLPVVLGMLHCRHHIPYRVVVALCDSVSGGLA